MAVDPANQDHLLIVSSDGNLHESTDAGANFTVRLSNPGGGNGCIVFDASSGTSVVNGVTVTSKFYMGWTAGFPAPGRRSLTLACFQHTVIVAG